MSNGITIIGGNNGATVSIVGLGGSGGGGNNFPDIFDVSGLVGINKPTPSFNLDIYNPFSAFSVIGNGSGSIWLTSLLSGGRSDIWIAPYPVWGNTGIVAIQPFGGMVGIGNEAPTAALDVQAPITMSDAFRVAYQGASYNFMRIYSPNSDFGFGGGTAIYELPDENHFLNMTAGSPWTWYSSDPILLSSNSDIYVSGSNFIVNFLETQIVFDSDGNITNTNGSFLISALGDNNTYFCANGGGKVGIVNNNPFLTLDVDGTIGNSLGTLSLNAGNNSIELNTADCNIIINGNGGNSNADITAVAGSITFSSAVAFPMGIGTTTPNYTLDVNGSIGNSAGDLVLLPASLGNVTFEMSSSRTFKVEDFSFNTLFGLISGNYFAIKNNSPKYTLDVSGSGNFSSIITGSGIALTSRVWNTLTCSGTTTWTTNQYAIEDRRILVMTGNSALAISGLYNGWNGLLQTIQSGISSSGYSITLPSGTKVASSGSGHIVLTAISGAYDMISFQYDGLHLFAKITNNYN